MQKAEASEVKSSPQVVMLAALIVLAVTSASLAATATFGRGQAGDYAVDKIDMVGVRTQQWQVDRLYGELPAPSGEGCYIERTIDDYQLTGGFVLLGFADLFTLISPTSGGGASVIEILDAQMQIINQSYDTAAYLVVNRCLTDWLVGQAGTNQGNVSTDESDVAGGVEWATYPDGIRGNSIDGFDANFPPPVKTSFGSNDFTTLNSVAEHYGGWQRYTTFNITDLLQDAYDAGENYGFVIESTAPLFKTLQDAGQTNNPAAPSPTYDPILIIEYQYVPNTLPYNLTVVSGTGSGVYTFGESVTVTAETAATGQAFDAWIGDIAGVADVAEPNSTITMAAGDASITATYYMASYTLTVFSGSGSGDYTFGEVVVVTANAAPTGQEFDAWIGDIGDVADTASTGTSVTMLAADITISSTYKPLPQNYLSGDLNEDLVVDITDLNMVLIDWGKSGGFVDANSDGDENGTIDITDLNLVLIDWGKAGWASP